MLSITKTAFVGSAFGTLLTLSAQVFAEDIEIYKGASLEEKEKARAMVLFDTSGSMMLSSDTGWGCMKGRGTRSRHYKEQNVCTSWDKENNTCDTWTYMKAPAPYESDGDYRYRMYQCDANVPDPVTDKCFYTLGKYAWGTSNESDLFLIQEACEQNSRNIVAKNTIKKLIEETPEVEFGLARLNGGDGGYIVAGIGSTQSELLSALDKFAPGGSTPLEEAASELHRYFSGSSLNYAKEIDGRDTSVESGSSYVSPFSNLVDGKYQARCDNNIALLIMTDGDPTADDAATYIKGLFTAEGATKPSTEHGSDLPNLAKYMAQYDVYKATSSLTENVFTYTIGFGNGMSSDGIDIMKKTANSDHGKGSYKHANNASELASVLKVTLNDIVEKSSGFTSPSVAASQSDNTRTKEFVYYSLFSPSSFSSWNGNIKKLKISGLKVVDQSQANAIDGNGNIKAQAKTFWTDYSASSDVQGVDGSTVTLGGLDDNLGNPNSRKIYTNVGGFTELLKTDSNVVSAVQSAMSALQGSTVAISDAHEMIDWMRGIKGYEDSGEAILRTHILGDALHSKPAAIVYENVGSDDTTHLLFGTNAGFVHFFEDTSETVATEVWSFIPTELFSIQPSLKKNEIGKAYGMDLTPTIYHDDANADGKVNAGETVWAYFGMRRGGSSYYALDISDRTSPKLLWKKTSGSDGYGNLGQTWSQPKIVFINHPSYSDKPLLVFGAGYDKKQFEDGAGNTVGAGIYLADAQTGDIVWSTDDISFAGSDSIVGRIATLDSDYDGYTDRLYAADTGGNIWRIDLAGTNMSDWSAFEFASLPGNFFYQPEVARSYYSKVTTYKVDNEVVNATRMTVPFEAVVIGSGDRTSPLDTSSDDSLYMIRDLNVITKSFKSNPPSKLTVTDLMTVTPETFGSLTSDYDKFVEKEHQYASYSGWRYMLTGSGEKALAKPAIIGGVAYFPTFIASDVGSSSCTLTGGEGRLYAFHLHYAVNIYENDYTRTGDSIPPTPELVFSEDSDQNSQFLLIGIGAGESNSGIIRAKSINDSAVPALKCDANNQNCRIELTSGFAGLRAHRSYMYRESKSKVN